MAVGGLQAAPRAMRVERAGVALLVAAVALAARWHAPEDVRALRPRPDVMEYVAGAQSIAQSGQYLLQVGPVRERPIYPPGYPLLLAGALALGLPLEALPRLSASAGAGLAALLALLAGAAVRRAAGSGGDGDLDAPRVRCAVAAAGLAAGLAWALGRLPR